MGILKYINTNKNNAVIRKQALQKLKARIHHAQPFIMAGQILAFFADNLAQPLFDLRVVDVIVIDPALVAGVIGWVYKDVIFDTSRSPEKCIKIAKTAENKAFLAVFAVLVVVQLAPLRRSQSAADAGIWAPVRLAQGKIKRFGQN